MLSRRAFQRGLLAGFIFCAFLGRRYVKVAASLAVMPFIFRYGDESMRLSEERDHFDITFDSYPMSLSINASLPIPPIIHNIFIGDSRKYRLSWDAARESCREQHPGYQFEFWDEGRAIEFVKKEFPETWPTWMGYKYPIQRADSLRYLILYHHGGMLFD
jgi:mannosyltransferase OCH1-like enzyme